MSIKNHVTNLELSKKLKEIGVKQRGCFDWVVNPNTNEAFIFQIKLDDGEVVVGENKYIAFLASELFPAIPPRVKNKDGDLITLYPTLEIIGEEKLSYNLRIRKSANVIFFDSDYYPDENPSNAVAIVLLQLIKEGFTTIDEINARIL